MPLPADYFELVCGTSTGGSVRLLEVFGSVNNPHRLTALLLGRLRLSVPEAVDKYRLLAKRVFSQRKSLVKDRTFKAPKLEKANYRPLGHVRGRNYGIVIPQEPVD